MLNHLATNQPGNLAQNSAKIITKIEHFFSLRHQGRFQNVNLILAGVVNSVSFLSNGTKFKYAYCRQKLLHLGKQLVSRFFTPVFLTFLTPKPQHFLFNPFNLRFGRLLCANHTFLVTWLVKNIVVEWSRTPDWFQSNVTTETNLGSVYRISLRVRRDFEKGKV